jgi:hypothetical protein
MMVSLHIERLVLDHLPIAARQSPEIQTAVEAELTRLLGERSVPSSLINTGAIDGLAGGTMRVEWSTTPVQVGTAIATAIHSALTGSASTVAPSRGTPTSGGPR